MSHRSEKKARKFIKNYLDRKDMDNQNKVQYTFAQLKNFVDLSVFLTGEKPKKIELIEAYYTWYVQEIMEMGNSLGLDTKLKDGKVTFMGIPLEKKVKVEIVVPKNN